MKIVQNHIRFINGNQAVCDYPERLGWDLVKIDNVTGLASCKECSALIMAHNKKEFELESDLAYEHNNLRTLPGALADTNPMDVFVTGLALASAFWVTVFVIWWAVWLR